MKCLQKLRRERTVWARLSHENILPLHGYCENDDEFGAYGALISPVCQILPSCFDVVSFIS
jgi:hypothetical protein